MRVVFPETKEPVMRKVLIHALVSAAVLVAVEMHGNALGAMQAQTSKPASEESGATAATPEQLKREKGNASSRMQQDRRRFARQGVAMRRRSRDCGCLQGPNGSDPERAGTAGGCS
jgi:hypothetical protein